jgi:hypothetical protein
MKETLRVSFSIVTTVDEGFCVCVVRTLANIAVLVWRAFLLRSFTYIYGCSSLLSMVCYNVVCLLRGRFHSLIVIDSSLLPYHQWTQRHTLSKCVRGFSAHGKMEQNVSFPPPFPHATHPKPTPDSTQTQPRLTQLNLILCLRHCVLLTCLTPFDASLPLSSSLPLFSSLLPVSLSFMMHVQTLLRSLHPQRREKGVAHTVIMSIMSIVCAQLCPLHERLFLLFGLTMNALSVSMRWEQTTDDWMNGLVKIGWI